MDKFGLNRDEAMLVVVDVQDRLATAMSERKPVTDNCLHLVAAARLLQVPILVTEQYPRGLGPTVEDIRGALPAYEPVKKITFDCCEEPAFMNRMRRIERSKVILAGMEAHVCVLQTCLGLIRAGSSVHVVSDAICSRNAANKATAIEMMRDAGAVITCTETALFQLLHRAGTDEFKSIVSRIK